MGQIRQIIPDELHRWLKAQASLAGVTIGEYLARLIREAKERDEQK